MLNYGLNAKIFKKSVKNVNNTYIATQDFIQILKSWVI